MNADAIYEGQRAADDGKRVFLLTRSGFAGLQRYSTATWSGDIATRWEDMKAQISAGLNFAVSGIPWWTMDIGGFCVENRYVQAQDIWDETGKENEDMREWRELNTRWFQFGAFAPLYRAHGQYPFREPWEIAPEGHPAYESIVWYTKLRYRLMPYIYSLAGKTWFDDYTIMRPLVMDFMEDTRVNGIGDAYMFGPAFLVAPVYEYGARTREICFPECEDGMISIRKNFVKAVLLPQLRLRMKGCLFMCEQARLFHSGLTCSIRTRSRLRRLTSMSMRATTGNLPFMRMRT